MLTGDDIWVAAFCLAVVILLACLGNLGSPKDKY
jgi:hypothetical protein